MGKGKLVLVTGGAGFIGSHLCERLVKEGYKVISLDNYFTGSRENHVAGVDYRAGHTKDVKQFVPEKPDIIFHLGEYSRVEQSFEEPELVFDLNIAGTHGIVSLWRSTGAKLVYAGSSTKFADNGLGRYQSPYAWTKATNTDLIKNYGQWFSLPYAVTYFYNVYGPRERAGAYGTVVEIFKQKHRKGETLTVEEPGTQRRNFTHVADIVDGLILVAKKGEGDDFGLGNNTSYSILELARMFGGEIAMVPSRRGNRLDSPIDTVKAERLGWSPRHNLSDYINENKS